MSTIKDTGWKNGSCGDLHHGVKDHYLIYGTDPHVTGVKTGASITVLTGDYSPPDDHMNGDHTFYIIPETAGIFFVTLADGTDFLITAVQSTAYLGLVWPGKIYSVNVGTTGNFSVVY